MKSRTADWFEIKLKYDKTMDDGLLKPVNEQYVVDAISFGEAETSITNEMSVYISGDFKITGITPAAYREIFISEDDKDDKWYKAKLQFITLDEKSGKEKRTNIVYLVQASSLHKAVKNIEEVMGTTSIDYAIVALNETKIMDVFQHDMTKNQTEKASEQ